jgi:anaerobic selenocysteine-containing dehydrogenase
MEGFHEGQKVWVVQPEGEARAGIFVSDAEIPGWFGGPPAAYVVYPDTRSGEEVSLLRVTPREEG